MNTPENDMVPERNKATHTNETATLLLDWYDKYRRTLPWRALSGEKPDVYKIWLSETMLQQTKVATVISYYQNFIRKWPSLASLADATQDDVLRAWAGLGYYARARNLYACAQIVMHKYGGDFPDTEEGLRSLPGVGPYTAAAITAIAYDRPAVVVDGNVARVISRLFRVPKPIPEAQTLLRELAANITPQDRPGDYAQAIMDLGAVICTPRSPKCIECPWAEICEARVTKTPEYWPRRRPKAKKPMRYGVAFWVERSDGAVMLRRRPDKGIFGGMTEIPNSGWHDQPLSERLVRSHAPIGARWVNIPKLINHSFTHFDMEITVLTTRSNNAPEDSFWCAREAIKSEALPSLMRKIAALVQATQAN